MLRSLRMLRSRTVICPVLISLLFLLLFCFSSPQISNAGDKNITFYITSEWNTQAGYYFISPYLCMLLHVFYNLFPCVNWWVVYSIMIMVVGLGMVSSVILGLNKWNWNSAIILSFVFIIFWEAIGSCQINFTQTASVASVSGMICIIYGMRHRTRSKFYLAFGVLFMVLSGLTRWKATLMLLPFGIMVSAYEIMQCLFKNNAASKKKKVIVRVKLKTQAVIVASFLLVIVAHNLYGIVQPQWKEYVSANSARENIFDYLDRYPGYGEVYENLGVDASMMEMIINNYTADINNFSSEKLQSIVQLRGGSIKTIKDAVNFLCNYKTTFIVLLLTIVYLIAGYGIKKSLVPLTGNMLGFLGGMGYCVYIGRFAWRVTNGLVLAFIVCFIYMICNGTTIKEDSGGGVHRFDLSLLL